LRERKKAEILQCGAEPIGRNVHVAEKAFELDEEKEKEMRRADENGGRESLSLRWFHGEGENEKSFILSAARAAHMGL
jgi:lysylphosphatidylglycerol synthetase-like protein (DUF2156 family)